MKVCVIGSNSFSGASFCAYLLERGVDVLAVSRSRQPDGVFLPYTWRPYDAHLRFERLDLNHELDRLFAMLQKHRPGFIFNFAAQSMVAESWDNPADWMTTNVVSLARLAERLRHVDFLDRYVHVTTPEVYGSTSGWVAEEATLNPSTPYAVSRTAGDMLMRIYQETFDLPVVSTRAANVYGAGQPLYRIIPRTVFYLLTGKTLQLHGGGSSSRSFIHIDDVCEATWRIACKAPVGETYHISTGAVVTIRELVEMLCGILGVVFEEAVQNSSERPGKDEAYWLKSDKIRQLGWAEQISLTEGIVGVIDWVRRELNQLKRQSTDYVHKP